MLTQGADMIYMSDDFENLYSGILAAVDEETLSEDDLDRAVGRILTLKLDMSGEDLGETAGEAADDLTETDDNGSVGDGASEMPTTQQQTTTEAAATRATTQQATTQQVTTTQSATTRATTTQQVTTTQEEITEAPATEAPAPQIGDAINMEE
jgi:hypothetical protein